MSCFFTEVTEITMKNILTLLSPELFLDKNRRWLSSTRNDGVDYYIAQDPKIGSTVSILE